MFGCERKCELDKGLTCRCPEGKAATATVSFQAVVVLWASSLASMCISDSTKDQERLEATLGSEESSDDGCKR